MDEYAYSQNVQSYLRQFCNDKKLKELFVDSAFVQVINLNREISRIIPFENSVKFSSLLHGGNNAGLDDLIYESEKYQHIHKTTMRDIRTLNTGEWLNDSVINNFALFLLEEYAQSLPTECDIMILSSQWYASLTKVVGKLEFASAKSTLQKNLKDIFAMRMALIPINLGNSHWALVAVFLEELSIVYFDSLYDNPKGSALIMENVLQYLHYDYMNTKFVGHPKLDQFKLYCKGVPVKVQTNGVDCGVFCLMFMDCLINGIAISSVKESACENYRKVVGITLTTHCLPKHELRNLGNVQPASSNAMTSTKGVDKTTLSKGNVIDLVSDDNDENDDNDDNVIDLVSDDDDD